MSSNIINVIQYVASIVLNKNIQSFKNQAIKVDFILVIFTIIIPILFIFLNIEANIEIVPLFIILYFFFMFLNSNAHNLYLKNEDLILENQIQAEGKWRRNNKSKIIKYVIYLILTGVFLFIIGNALGNTLNVLCNDFNVSQTIVGVLLGGITSIPELITFLESQKHHKKLEKQNILGVVEATNNLLTSNVLNLFIIQSVGILLCKFFPLTL